MADISNEKREPVIVQQAIHVSDSSNTDCETQRPKSTAKKYLYHIPWASAAELLIVVLTIVGAVVLVVCIDGKQQWPTSVHIGKVRGRELNMSLITPATILSVAHSIIAFLIGLAVKDGITMAWWRRTLAGGTVKSLEQNYRFGTSLKDALLARKEINIIAVATIGAAIAAMAQGPLMQRSLTTKLSTADSSVSVSVQMADEIPPGFTGINLGSIRQGQGASFYTNEFSSVMKDYTDRVPMQPIISGCNGTCTGFMRGPGWVPVCTMETVPYQYLSNNSETSNPHIRDNIDTETGASVPTQASDVFSIVFNDLPYRADDENNIVWMQMQIDVAYASLVQLNDTNADGSRTSMNCDGTKTTRSCVLSPALVEYPLIISTLQANGSSKSAVVQIDPKPDPFSYKTVAYQNLSLVGDQVTGHSATVTTNGLTLAMRQLYLSYFTLGPFDNNSATPLIADVFNPIAATYLTATDEEFVNIGNTCAVQFSDPTADIMRALNEITFRIGLGATNGSTPVANYTVLQTKPVNRYKATPAYWASSLGITLLSIAMIIPSFYGWWQLGRKVSLNPIEMAEAFNAPVLQHEDLHKDADHLLELVGERKVKYVPVEHELGEGGLVKKMEIVDVESPNAPVGAGEGRAKWVGGWRA
ncbi:hypothetical protein VTL71DRAFT_2094 [Oculimacula yallundae]|uniref:Uncharacterized protein n=1 Tax=Oculimacula yallundae TaxID=86028 RepID=A0ABR4CA36_9HELO